MLELVIYLSFVSKEKHIHYVHVLLILDTHMNIPMTEKLPSLKLQSWFP